MAGINHYTIQGLKLTDIRTTKQTQLFQNYTKIKSHLQIVIKSTDVLYGVKINIQPSSFHQFGLLE
jgi:hypothetical protein